MEYKRTTIGVTTAMALLALASPLSAQDQRPPKPDLAKMASSMGVSEDALKGCLPARDEGERSRPPRPDASALAACLKKAGFSVTENKISETLEASRPRRRQQ